MLSARPPTERNQMASSRTQAWPSIRISAPQLELLVADVEPRHWIMFKVLPPGFPEAPCSDHDKPDFADCHVLLMKLWKRLCTLKSGSKQGRYRLELRRPKRRYPSARGARLCVGGAFLFHTRKSPTPQWREGAVQNFCDGSRTTSVYSSGEFTS